MADEPEEFVCTYRYGGRQYGINVFARDYREASAHLRAIGTTGSVDGVLVSTIPLPSGPRYLRAMKKAIASVFGGRDR